MNSHSIPKAIVIDRNHGTLNRRTTKSDKCRSSTFIFFTSFRL